ncbi:MAG: transcription termination/antitermination NusG family protein, partial [Candidatus Sulfotelmatobacter sp.]
MECLSAVPEMLGAPADDFRAMKWYAVYTCVRHEKRVAEQMEQRQLPSFLPLYRALHRWKDRQKEVELALFPGYVFVHLALRDRLRVLEIPSVVHLVSFQGKPTPLPQFEIEKLRQGVTGRVRME